MKRAAFAIALLVTARAHAGACEDLTAAARNHEAHGDGDVALRQYSEAITLDPTCATGWLGLASLRSRMGDVAEAERVYTAALSHLPTLAEAIAARARARWQLGRTDEAEDDMLHFAEKSAPSDRGRALAALEELARWYGSVRQTAAQLGVWRRILSLADGSDEATFTRARVHVAALVAVVATADPVTHPPRVDLLRSVAARLRR